MITELASGGGAISQGPESRLVGTALHSYAMPFIRFQLGDLVTAGPPSCACGQPFSTFTGIKGRVVDYFTLADGSLVHPFEIAAAMKDFGMRWIGQYQLVQHTVNRVVLSVVPSREPGAGEIDAMRASVVGVLGNAVTFDVQLVDDIPLGKTGKFRVYESLVDSADASGGSERAPEMVASA